MPPSQRYHRGTIRQRGRAYQADVRAGGKRHRRDFESPEEARAWIDAVRAEHDLGRRPLDVWQMRDASRALEILPEGVSLTDAAEYYRREIGTASTITVADATRQFLADKRAAGRRASTLDQLTWMIGKLPQDAALASIDTAALEAVLEQLGYVGTTRDNFRRAWRGFFNWARRRALVGSRNPADGISAGTTDPTPPAILTVDQCADLLDATRTLTPDFLAYVALGLFAGLRPDEAARIHWSAIRPTEIVIGPEVTKVRRQRHVALEPACAAWLDLAPGKRRGPVWGRPAVTAKRRRATLLAALEWPEWPQDGLRHTFASYHLARGQDAPATAHQLGHPDPSVLYRHYRAPVAPTEALRFWALTPETVAEMVTRRRNSKSSKATS